MRRTGTVSANDKSPPPNQSLEQNRRPAFALDTDRKLASVLHDPACLSGGGRSAYRSAAGARESGKVRRLWQKDGGRKMFRRHFSAPMFLPTEL